MARKQSSNQWSGGIAAHPTPNISSTKIRWKSSCLDFLGSRRHPPHWLSSKDKTINAEYYEYLSLLVQLNDILKEKHRVIHQGVRVLARQCPASPGTCNLEGTDVSGLPMSYHPPYSPDLAPSDYHLFPGLKKKMEIPPFFVRRGGHCCRGDLVGRTTS